MKQQKPMQNPIPTAAVYRRTRIQRMAMVCLRILLVVTTVVFVWIIDIGCAAGWISNAAAGENWPSDFVGYGQMMIGASVLLTAAGVLVLCRKNWIGLGIGSVGILFCLIPLIQVASYAGESGFYSRIMEMPVKQMYYMEILPTLLAYGSLAGLAVLQHFSQESRAARRKKQEAQNRKAPSILGD